MDTNRRRKQSGQGLVLFAVILLGLLALLALVLDGGTIYSYRRTAQAAADAAALAAADVLCSTRNGTAAQTAATNYATQNKATLTFFAFDVNAKTVDVAVEIQHTTFFAHLLGQPTVTVPAEAGAHCTGIGYGEGVLPVAWTCRQPIAIAGPTPTPDPNFPAECNMLEITYNDVLTRISNGNINPATGTLYSDMYMIMESNTSDSDACAPAGSIDCDFDNDGTNDVVVGGARGWLDLDSGGGGASDLATWIRQGFPGEIKIHSWLPTESGVSSTTFGAVYNRVFVDNKPIVAVPVFNNFCMSRPFDGVGNIDPTCAPFVDGAIDWQVWTDMGLSGGAGQTYYHIVGFAAFYVTCVHGGPGWVATTGTCPGFNTFAAQNAGILSNGNINSMKSIEGYYLGGYIPGLGGSGGADTGAYNISLDR